MPIVMMVLQAAAAVGIGTPPALLTPAYGITPDDYPKAALALEQQGRVVARLLIDEKGTIAACTIISSSGSDALDAGTCEALRRRTRFSPALDASGHPKAVHYVAPVNWAIPDEEQVVSQSIVVTATFVGDLTPTTCSALIGNYRLDLASADCRAYAYLFPVGPIRTALKGSIGIRATAEQRQQYYSDFPLAPAFLPGTRLAQVSATFSINSEGQPVGCMISDPERLAMLRHGSPCATGRRFDVSTVQSDRLPIRATWTATVNYVPVP